MVLSVTSSSRPRQTSGELGNYIHSHCMVLFFENIYTILVIKLVILSDCSLFSIRVKVFKGAAMHFFINFKGGMHFSANRRDGMHVHSC